MSIVSGKDLAPDKALLNCIFPRFKPATTTILSQTYEVCTFIAHTDATHQTGTLHEDVIVRLELPKNRSRTVSALQQIATLAIPEAVPTILQIGTAKAEDGREIDFSISAFVADAVTLETVWDDLADDKQSNIMDSVLNAMRKLQALNLADESVQKILEARSTALLNTTGQGGDAVSKPNIAYGSLDIGFFKDIPDLLTGIIAYNGVGKELTLSSKNEPRENGVIIASTYEGIPEVHIGRKELESLQQLAVFCHNDLEPRNILVRPVHLDDGSVCYELAAIIDWEMAGFFPFAYEYSVKDAHLGSSNTYFSWYALFKQRTAPLLPVAQLSQSQMLFMQVMDLIKQLRFKQQKRNVGALFREKWFQRERLVPGAFLWSGWERGPDATAVRVYGKEDNKLLEEEILKELGFL
ncbi:MAG: hypothetical protein Q9166_007575 [cf. Caloplaca sp. 2 TL-2023]